MVAKHPQDTEKKAEVSWLVTTKLTMVGKGLLSAPRVANRPTIIQDTMCIPCTIHTHLTTLGTLAAKVAPLSHCVGKTVES